MVELSLLINRLVDPAKVEVEHLVVATIRQSVNTAGNFGSKNQGQSCSSIEKLQMSNTEITEDESL